MDYKITADGTKTLYSSKYNQTFHSTKAGALSESLYKHIIPAFSIVQNSKDNLNILDICFGLGYNTFSTIYFCKKNNINTKINFFTPELDGELIETLRNFEYPREFNNIRNIIDKLFVNKYYHDEQFTIELFIGDARGYIKNLNVLVDIVYQDAFSSDVNQELWSQEYFRDIKDKLAQNAIITTYSIATPVRLSMYENGLNIYQYQAMEKSKSTIATNFKIYNENFQYIDMERKKINNPTAQAIYDSLEE